jgi:hypothetical protein
VDFDPGLERLLHGLRDGDLAFASALGAHEQTVVPSVRPRPAEIPGARDAQLGGPQTAAAEHAQ